MKKAYCFPHIITKVTSKVGIEFLTILWFFDMQPLNI